MSNATEVSRQCNEHFFNPDSDIKFDYLSNLADSIKVSENDIFGVKPDPESDSLSLDFFLQDLGEPCSVSTSKGQQDDVGSFTLGDLLQSESTICNGLDRALYKENRASSCKTSQSESVDATHHELPSTDIDDILSNLLLTAPRSQKSTVLLADQTDSYLLGSAEVSTSDDNNDTAFTLADLYAAEKPRLSSLSDSSLSDSLTDKDSSPDDCCTDSGYSSEREKPECYIDLSQAKSVAKHDVVPSNGEIKVAASASEGHTRKRLSSKAKPSLFFETLCCSMKPYNSTAIPIVPQCLEELMGKMDYWKFFSFDTPSPDDVVKRKQRNTLYTV